MELSRYGVWGLVRSHHEDILCPALSAQAKLRLETCEEPFHGVAARALGRHQISTKRVAVAPTHVFGSSQQVRLGTDALIANMTITSTAQAHSIQIFTPSVIWCQRSNSTQGDVSSRVPKVSMDERHEPVYARTNEVSDKYDFASVALPAE